MVKFLAKVFSMDSLGKVNCQFETESIKYGKDNENRKPTIKPTRAAITTAFLLRDLTSAVRCLTNSTEFRFRWSLFINLKSDDSSGSKFENKDFNLSSSIRFCLINCLITSRADVCGLAKDVASPHLVRFPVFQLSPLDTVSLSVSDAGH